MIAPEEFDIPVPGFRLAARAWGPADGLPILALHGWLDNAASFDALAPLVPGLRIVALDLPGHGLSSHAPPGFLYPFVDLVAAAYWVGERMGWPRFGLMGHSLGASVCAVLAGTMPERVARLVLLDGLGPLSDEPSDAPARLARALLEQGKKAQHPLAVYPSRARVETLLANAPSKMTQRSVQTLLARGLEETEDGVRWRSDRRLRFASRLRFSEAHVLAFLRRIACPTLFVRADEGFTIDPARAQARVDAVPDLELVEVPGRHHVHLDAPQRVAPAVARFFEPLR